MTDSSTSLRPPANPYLRALHANPRRFARIAGAFYLMVFVFGIAALGR